MTWTGQCIQDPDDSHIHPTFTPPTLFSPSLLAVSFSLYIQYTHLIFPPHTSFSHLQSSHPLLSLTSHALFSSLLFSLIFPSLLTSVIPQQHSSQHFFLCLTPNFLPLASRLTPIPRTLTPHFTDQPQRATMLSCNGRTLIPENCTTKTTDHCVLMSPEAID